MSDIAIKAENVGKLYRLGQIGTGTISHDLNRWWARMRGKEDPFAKIGETNDRATKGENEYVWALKEIDFEIKKGEAVGIIGRNGAGKSTLLKLLSKVTKPTTGEIKIKGRIASLLEVGTGFHPEMTGKENIYMNGAILGMTKKEITRKFDEIVDFSGVERYIDTPVKRYSSGMYVRLAFAVAAHLESEILIVDEVLAVGDADFQKKCLGKMGDVSKGEGRTVLFVSHNMSAVRELCDYGIGLSNGNLIIQDKIDLVVTKYLTFATTNNEYVKYPDESINGQFNKISIFDEDGIKTNSFKSRTQPYLIVDYSLKKACNNFHVALSLYDAFNNHIYSSADNDLNPNLLKQRKVNTYTVKVPIPLYNLNTGNYRLKLLMGIINTELFDEVELSFSVENKNFTNAGIRPGILLSLNSWEYL